MGLNQFTIKEARPLPVFLLVDASGSMQGSKIDKVNNALREMLHTLRHLEGAKGQIEVSIIKISGQSEVIQPLAKVQDITPPQLTASGKTPIGQSIREVVKMIEDKGVVPVRAYIPIIILISDGIPTDITREMHENRPITMEQYLAWEPMQLLHSKEYSKKSMKLALGIGEDADYAMLKAFIKQDNVPVIQANNVTTIGKFFEWVTRTVTQRSLSADPNRFEGIPYDDIFEIEEIVL